MSSTSYFRSRYYPSSSRALLTSRSPSPMEQYNDLSTRYQQLTDKYVNLKQKYRDFSKYSPWSHTSNDSDELSRLSAARYRSPTPVIAPATPRQASRVPERYTSSSYRTPPPAAAFNNMSLDEPEEPLLTSEAIMRKYRSPLTERQVERESPRMKNPSILDRELEIIMPRYKQREELERKEALLRKKEPTPPPAKTAREESVENGYSAEGLPPVPYTSRYDNNKYALKYHHNVAAKHRTHANVPKYESFVPVKVKPARKFVCSARELNEIIVEPSGGVYVLPNEPYNEVYPDVFIGDMHTALCTQQLRALGITHVLNASQKDPRPGVQEPGYYVNTTAQYYRRVGIEFLGVPATDSLSFDISQYFQDAASFIDSALHTNGLGISRSATLVLAFLMLRRGMTAQDAMRTVRAKRQIIPNESFLRQLVELNSKLMSDRRNYYRK
ncbi:uncharacterized protein LOC132200128 [Neocloeon triangulifer]|uniref:uncharacterized protein LOC132200128 n=1 Tax=Neocloeon triangulifer TaxID=2078957 RepID=UPI00286F0E54|nr:uncharacterized protein LOC132200128 [Neocloeon triangulifer]